MRRIFLAVPVPAGVSDYGKALQIANAGIEGIRWLNLSDLHLTCYFIGNVPEDDFGRVVDIVRSVIASQQPFSLDFEKVILVPSHSPRMIWAKYHKHPVFSDLSARIHAALSGIIPHNKSFHSEPIPHITLARFHEKVARKNEIEVVPARLPSINVDTIELWESKQIDHKTRYEKSVNLFPRSFNDRQEQ